MAADYNAPQGRTRPCRHDAPARRRGDGGRVPRGVPAGPSGRLGGSALPDRLSDAEFWQLITTLSEPNGFFRSDNLVSNEAGYQSAVPGLQRATAPGGVYLGVGPEQNLTYIAAVRPSLAFIVDIRRGNRDLQLMYKRSSNCRRIAWTSSPGSSPVRRPEGLAPGASPGEVFAAFDASGADTDTYAPHADGDPGSADLDAPPAALPGGARRHRRCLRLVRPLWPRPALFLQRGRWHDESADLRRSPRLDRR